MSDSKIIEKITKLLALANESNGGTEAERELAMKRAQELMLKYNIDYSIAHEGKRSAPGDVTDHTIPISGAMNLWKVDLIGLVADPLFVQAVVYRTAKHGRRVMLVGRPDNIAFVNTLVDHLIPWLEAECKIATGVERENREQIGAFFNPRAFKRSFMQSASTRIHYRLKSMRNSSGVGTDLVRHEGAANMKYLEDLGIRLKKGAARRGSGELAGHQAGRAAGEKADLTPGRKLNA